MPLRSYQFQALDKVQRFFDTNFMKRKVILVSPTGSGKTSMGSEAAKRAVSQGKKVLWLAHRRELITQASQRIAADGLPDHGVLLAGYPVGNPNSPLQVASVDTLRIRKVRPPADLIIWDECFPSGTLVDGRPINEIQVGDYVNAYDHLNGLARSRRVVRLFRSKPSTLLTLSFTDGTILTCTFGHPFSTPHGYKTAISLVPGDHVHELRSDSVYTLGLRRVESIKSHLWTDDGTFGGLCADGLVYNIEVEGLHNYFTNGLLVHNCHHTKAASWSQIQSEYPDAYSLGLTATPCRGDGAPLGDVFDGMVVAATIRQLQKAGYLVPCRIIAPKMSLGSKRLARDPLHEWQARAQGKQTVVFLNTLEECYSLVHRFKEAGAKAAVVESETPITERTEILRKFAAKELDVLCNVSVLTEGWDNPSAEVGIVARSVGHIGLWMQIIGRFLRPAPGKKFATILDLAGNVHLHGLPEADLSFSLDGGIHQKGDGEILCCPYCGIMVSRLPCPHCGKGKRSVSHRVRIEEQDIFEILRPPPGDDGRPIKKRWREDALYLARYAAHQRLERDWIYLTFQERHQKNLDFDDRPSVDAAHQRTWLELFEEVYDPQPPVYHSWTMYELATRAQIDRYVRPPSSLPEWRR